MTGTGSEQHHSSEAQQHNAVTQRHVAKLDRCGQTCEVDGGRSEATSPPQVGGFARGEGDEARNLSPHEGAHVGSSDQRARGRGKQGAATASSKEQGAELLERVASPRV